MRTLKSLWFHEEMDNVQTEMAVFLQSQVHRISHEPVNHSVQPWNLELTPRSSARLDRDTYDWTAVMLVAFCAIS